MGKCMYCGINTGLFKSVHANCQEQYTTNMVALMESGRFKDAADAAEKSVYADKSRRENSKTLLMLLKNPFMPTNL